VPAPSEVEAVPTWLPAGQAGEADSASPE
jgi:hypothetical protein